MLEHEEELRSQMPTSNSRYRKASFAEIATLLLLRFDGSRGRGIQFGGSTPRCRPDSGAVGIGAASLESRLSLRRRPLRLVKSSGSSFEESVRLLRANWRRRLDPPNHPGTPSPRTHKPRPRKWLSVLPADERQRWREAPSGVRVASPGVSRWPVRWPRTKLKPSSAAAAHGLASRMEERGGYFFKRLGGLTVQLAAYRPLRLCFL